MNSDIQQDILNLNTIDYSKPSGDMFSAQHFELDKKQLSVYVFRKKYSDFSTAGLTNNVTIFQLPKLCEITNIFMNVVIAFAGCTTYTISAGIVATPTTLLTAQDVTTTGLKLAKGTDFTTNTATYSTSAKTAIVARATSTVDNLSAATAGIIDFYVTYISYPSNA